MCLIAGDSQPPAVAELTDSTPLLARPATLRGRLADDGYLLLRGVLSSTAVVTVARDLLGVLRAQGIVSAGALAEWSGAPLEQIDDVALYTVESYQGLCESESLIQVLELVFAEAASVFRSTNIRYALPYDTVHVTPAHQDHFFVGPRDDFLTAWIPLMPIPRCVGGLAVVPRSHLGGLLEHREVDRRSYALPGRRQKGVPDDVLGTAPWATTDYAVGDVLLFHSHCVHAALPNRSTQVRLSLDTRAQAASSPVGWQAAHTMLETRALRAAAQRVIAEHRLLAPGAETEPVLARVIMLGIPPSVEALRRLIDGDSVAQ